MKRVAGWTGLTVARMKRDPLSWRDVRPVLEAALVVGIFTVSMILWMASQPSVETEQTLRCYSESEVTR